MTTSRPQPSKRSLSRTSLVLAALGQLLRAISRSKRSLSKISPLCHSHNCGPQSCLTSRQLNLLSSLRAPSTSKTRKLSSRMFSLQSRQKVRDLRKPTKSKHYKPPKQPPAWEMTLIKNNLLEQSNHKKESDVNGLDQKP